MKSRLFPKTRSWLALGAPLELLSPLSVLRVVYALMVVLCGVAGLAVRWPPHAGAWVLAVVGVAAAVWVHFLRVKDVSPAWCRVLVALSSTLVLALVHVGRTTAPVVDMALLLLPLAMFVAALPRRPRGRRLSRAAGGGAVAGPRRLPRRGSRIGCRADRHPRHLVGIADRADPTRSVWRSGTVDPDTGLPNGIGLARRFSARDEPGSPRAFFVATVHLAGIDDARQALGYRVGIELLRRAVEDLGQVVPARRSSAASRVTRSS